MPDLMSSWFVRSLREDPAEAEAPGHRLLLRAGYVRRVAAGGYAWLPLGLTVLRNVERIVRAELDRTGAQEVLFPVLPGRAQEELFALLAKAELGSYKDLPLAVYQVQTRVGDEPRSRSGLLHSRESVTQDACSFDLDDDGLAVSYAAHREAYLRIFARLGLDVRVVSAASGAPGGSAEEFVAPTPAGADTYATCPQCGYAATAAAVPSPPRTAPIAEPGPVEELDTPGTPTIETLAAHLGLPASATVTVVDGDPCPRCGGPLTLAPGVRVGRLARLGRRYADAFALDVPGPDRAPVRLTMGSYGIGLSRAVAVIAEQHHDERGLVWPREVAPYDVQVVPVGRGDQPAYARDLAVRLEDTGLRVLVDDRDAGAGVKLTDAELIGVPWTVVVGRRAAEGVVEVRDRARGEVAESRMDDVVWAVTR